MSQNDYYEILGLSKDASHTDIKKAYRKLAHKYHPDRNSDPDAESKFKEVSAAYEVLSDPEKKEQYDNFGHAGPQVNWSGNPFDIFNSFFHGGGRPQKGRDLRVELIITLEDVLNGAKKTISYMRHSLCTNCKGKGGKGSSCPQCGGYGQVRRQQGFISMSSTCMRCGGSGIEIIDKCKECDGQGEIGSKHSATVEIPVGVKTGNHIRIQGRGDVTDPKYPPGDLLCRINIEPHPVFLRNDKDIQCVEEISYAEACLGTTIKVPTLGGKKEKLTIPPGTQFGQTFKIKNRGLPTLRRANARGDQYVRIHINVPKDLSEEAKNILKDFDKTIKA